MLQEGQIYQQLSGLLGQQSTILLIPSDFRGLVLLSVGSENLVPGSIRIVNLDMPSGAECETPV